MSRHPAGALRVALVDHGAAEEPRRIAQALGDAGHDTDLLTATPAPARMADRLLRRRRIDAPLAHVPFTLSALLAGGYDVAHAFSPADAVAALAWRRLSGRPVVFGCYAAPRRPQLADRRLRLSMLSRALEQSDAVVVPGDDVREAAKRWLAVPAAVVDPGDAAGHDQLYRRLIASRATPGRGARRPPP